MYVAGTVPDSRRAVCALRTCMRSWRTRKSGRPSSLRAMTSPSTSRSRSPDRPADALISGQATSRRCRSGSTSEAGRRRRRRTSVSTRMPSHLTSCTHSGPGGTWVPRWRASDAWSHLGPCLSVAACETGRMRAIWKGAVSFGLVSVPVKLYTATESHDVSFRQVHAKDGGRIKYQRVCSIDGEEVAYADIAKGYETEDGEMVILADDDLAELPRRRRARSRSRSSCRRPDRPDAASRSPTTSSRRRPAPSPMPCSARRSSTPTGWPWSPSRCGNVRPSPCSGCKDDVIVLQTMMWPDEVRQPDFNVDGGEVKDAEVKMANMLVETLAGDFDASEFEDDYAEAVEALVKAKIEGGEVKRTADLDQDLRRGRRPAGRAAAVRRGGQDRARRGRRRREEEAGQEGREEDRQEGRQEEGQLAAVSADRCTRCEVRSRRSRLGACGL